MTKTFCDLCKKEIRTRHLIDIDHVISEPGVGRNHSPYGEGMFHVEVCEACAKLIVAAVRRAAEEAAQQ